MDQNNALLFVRRASEDDEEWLELIWETNDIADEGDKYTGRSNLERDNRDDFYHRLGLTPETLGDVEDKFIRARLFQDRSGKWRLDADSLYWENVKDDPRKNGIGRGELTMVAASTAPQPTAMAQALTRANVQVPPTPMDSLKSYVEETKPVTKVVPAKVAPAKTKSAAGVKGGDTKALKRLVADCDMLTTRDGIEGRLSNDLLAMVDNLQQALYKELATRK